MLDVRPRDGFGIFTVISNYYGDSGIVSSHAVDKILKLIITQESLGSYGNEGADIVVCREEGSDRSYNSPANTSVQFLHNGIFDCGYGCRLHAGGVFVPPLDPVLYSFGVTP